MFESLGKAWGAVKSGAVETGAKAYINHRIGDFGSVTKFQIDPRERTILIEVELKGEISPISIRVGSYNVVESNGAKYISLRNVQASREWIGLAVEQYIARRQFEIPDSIFRML